MRLKRVSFGCIEFFLAVLVVAVSGVIKGLQIQGSMIHDFSMGFALFSPDCEAICVACCLAHTHVCI